MTVYLNATDPDFLKVIPLILLIKRSNLKLLDCIGQGITMYKKN